MGFWSSIRRFFGIEEEPPTPKANTLAPKKTVSTVPQKSSTPPVTSTRRNTSYTESPNPRNSVPAPTPSRRSASRDTSHTTETETYVGYIATQPEVPFQHYGSRYSGFIVVDEPQPSHSSHQHHAAHAPAQSDAIYSGGGSFDNGSPAPDINSGGGSFGGDSTPSYSPPSYDASPAPTYSPPDYSPPEPSTSYSSPSYDSSPSSSYDSGSSSSYDSGSSSSYSSDPS